MSEIVIVCKECCGLMYLHEKYYNDRDWWVCSICGYKELVVYVDDKNTEGGN